MSKTITLDGNSLTRKQLVTVAHGGASVELDPNQLARVQRAANSLADKVSCGEPTYGVTTGFGSNADKLLGAHRLREELPGGNPHQPEGTLLDELQHNLIITHAVCVGKPFAEDVVRAMLVIRINTLMRGHSGIRACPRCRRSPPCSTPVSYRWCRRRVRSAPATAWRRCRTWRSCCWVAVKPSTRASAWRAPRPQTRGAGADPPVVQGRPGAEQQVLKR